MTAIPSSPTTYNRLRMRAYRAQRRADNADLDCTVARPQWCGSPNGYSNHGCRGGWCSLAESARRFVYRATGKGRR